jgi:RimJ/RimL family protein N-acetyltransferase
MIELRPTTSADSPLIRAWLLDDPDREGWISYPYHLARNGWQPHEDHTVANDGGRVWTVTAVENGRPVGFVLFSAPRKYPKHVLRVVGAGVDPAQRRRGIAREIGRAVLATLRATPYREVWAVVNSERADIHRLLTDVGFHESGETLVSEHGVPHSDAQLWKLKVGS